MTIRYVGPGGSDGNDGLSWANRKLTLNGVEDTPVVAGDIIYVGPGTYRELLTLDVSGSDGNQIEYVADSIGIYTDGVGGEVRISGSNDDKTSSRSYCITFGGHDYRTFRGFRLDLASQMPINMLTAGSTGIIIEDCSILGYVSGGDVGAYIVPSSGNTITFRRCYISGYDYGVRIVAGALTSTNYLFENCFFTYTGTYAVRSDYTYGMTFKNCTFQSVETSDFAIYVINVTTGNNVYVYNCVFDHARLGATSTGVIVEDYGIMSSSIGSPMLNVTPGANFVYRNLFRKPSLLYEGFYFPNDFMDYLSISPLKLYGCGQSPPADDFFGITRPTTDSKKTRGAIQIPFLSRETTTIPSGETESIKMPDAGSHQIIIPITGNKMRFSVKVYREANYSGTNPQIIIQQPGQSNYTVTDIGSSGTWNTLAISITPADFPTWVAMEIRSNNEATSGNYATYWGAFEVK